MWNSISKISITFYIIAQNVQKTKNEYFIHFTLCQKSFWTPIWNPISKIFITFYIIAQNVQKTKK